MRDRRRKRIANWIVIRLLHQNNIYFRIRLSIPNIETEANRDVEGKRKGFIFPFIATPALKIEKERFKIVKNTTVIIPFLADAKSRDYAATSIRFGGKPPLALLGRSLL